MRTVLCKDAQGNAEEIPVDKLSFRPSIYGIVIRNNRVLLAGFKDGWTIPGGGVDIGESFADAFQREVRDETGVTANIGTLVHGEDGFFLDANAHAGYHQVRMYFTGSYMAGDVSLDHLSEAKKGDHSLARWVPMSEIQSLAFYGNRDSVRIIRRAAL